MRKKWLTSTRSSSGASTSSQKSPSPVTDNSQCNTDANQAIVDSKQLIPQKLLTTNLFNSIIKLDRKELENYLTTNDDNNNNNGGGGVGVVLMLLKQKLWGLSLGHVLLNRSDDEIMNNINSRNNQHDDDGSGGGEELKKNSIIEKVNEILKMLIELGLDLNVEEKSGMKPIHLAAKRCSFSFVWIMTMIESGKQSAMTCCGSELGYTPLHYAVSNNRLKLVRDMLECESVDFGEFRYSNSNWRRLLPIHIASQSGNVEIVELLIEHACTCFHNKSPNLLEWSEFITAIPSPLDLNSFVKYFLSIKTQDSYGQTSLHLAVRDGHVNCVKLLLEKGADPLESDKNGKTVIDYARINFINKQIIIEELQKYVEEPILVPPFIESIDKEETSQYIDSSEDHQAHEHQFEDQVQIMTESKVDCEEEENENIYFM